MTQNLIRLLVQDKIRVAMGTPEFREQLITELSEEDFLSRDTI